MTQEELLFVVRMRDEMTAQIATIAGAFTAANIGIRSTLGSFASWEQGMSAVQKTTGLAGVELSKFKDGFDVLARSMPVPIKTLQDIAAAAGSLGIEGQADILKFTEVIGKMGVSTNLAGEHAAQKLARMMNVMHEAPGTVNQLADVLVTLDNHSAATAREITAVATEVALATAPWQIGTKETAALGAAMAELGINAERGGTAIGRAFIALDQGIRGNLKNGVSALTQLTGMTQQQMKELEASSPTAMFDVFMSKLHDAIVEGKNYNAILQELTLNQAQTAKSLVPLAAAYDNMREKERLVFDQTSTVGQLDKEFGIFAGNMTQKLTLARNAWDLLGKDIGATTAEPIKAAIDAITASLNSLDAGFKTLSPGLQRLIAYTVEFSGAAAGLAVGLRLMVGLLPTLLGPWGLLAISIVGVTQAILDANGFFQRNVEISQADAEAIKQISGNAADAAHAINDMTEAQRAQLEITTQLKLVNLNDELIQTAHSLNGRDGLTTAVDAMLEKLGIGRDKFNETSNQIKDLKTQLANGAISLDDYAKQMGKIAEEHPNFAPEIAKILEMVQHYKTLTGQIDNLKTALDRLQKTSALGDIKFPGDEVNPWIGIKPEPPPPESDFKTPVNDNHALQVREFMKDSAQRIKALQDETAAYHMTEEAAAKANRTAQEQADVRAYEKRAETLKLSADTVTRMVAEYRSALAARDDAKLAQEQDKDLKTVNDKIAAMAAEQEALLKGKEAYEANKLAAKIDPEVKAFSQKLLNLGMEKDAVDALVRAYRDQATQTDKARQTYEANNRTQQDAKQLATDVATEVTNSANAFLFQGKTAGQAARDFSNAISQMIVKTLLLKPLEREMQIFMDSLFTPGSTGSRSGGLGSLGGVLGLAGKVLSLFGSGGADPIAINPADVGTSTAMGAGVMFGLSGHAHGGGVVGAEPPTFYKGVDPRVFIGAPRFHTGLNSDEFATILQRGERVLTAQQDTRMGAALMGLTASAANSNRGGQQNVVFNIQTPNADSFQRSQTQIYAQAASALRRTQRRLNG